MAGRGGTVNLAAPSAYSPRAAGRALGLTIIFQMATFVTSQGQVNRPVRNRFLPDLAA
jgi:hypothetical protein